MNRHLLYFILAFLGSLNCLAQGPSGLIAHWKMNGDALDASGNGHHGVMRSVVAAPGRGGNPGTALYFNGINSHLNIPYSPDLNMSAVSICATISVTSFNPAHCEANYLLARGPQFGSSSYSLLFFDNAYNGCGTLDTNLVRCPINYPG